MQGLHGHPAPKLYIKSCTLSVCLQVPTCVKACTYPGTVIGGVMVSNVKFYYPVGSQVQYECLPGLTLDGAPMLECLENAIWSSSVPLCTNPLKTN